MRESLKAVFLPIVKPKSYYKHGRWQTSFAPKELISAEGWNTQTLQKTQRIRHCRKGRGCKDQADISDNQRIQTLGQHCRKRKGERERERVKEKNKKHRSM